MQIKKETILRTIVMLLALINSVLTMTGKNPVPYSEAELYEGLSAALAVITTLWSWWKNNSFTLEALKADEYLKEMQNAR